MEVWIKPLQQTLAPYMTPFKLKLIALGWSDTVMEAQFGIIPRHDRDTCRRLQELLGETYGHEFDRRSFAHALNIWKIPRVLSVHEKIRGTGKMAVLTICPEQHRSATNLFNATYSTVTVVVHVYDVGSVPEVDAAKWNPGAFSEKIRFCGQHDDESEMI